MDASPEVLWTTTESWFSNPPDPPAGIFGNLKNVTLQNPVQAVDWFTGLRHDKFGAAGVESIVREWLAADPIAACSFVGTMSPGPEKDAEMWVFNAEAQRSQRDAEFK